MLPPTLSVAAVATVALPGVVFHKCCRSPEALHGSTARTQHKIVAEELVTHDVGLPQCVPCHRSPEMLPYTAQKKKSTQRN
eukprot:6293557-Amphidinium_carterae.1